jgi:hypothetical protein
MATSCRLSQVNEFITSNLPIPQLSAHLREEKVRETSERFPFTAFCLDLSSVYVCRLTALTLKGR